MNILVFSDSHRALSGMYHAIEQHAPHQVLHLGDLMEDAQEVAHAYPTIPFCMVPGNCDGWTTQPAKREIILADKRVLMSHGHLWGVKQSIHTAIDDAKACNAHILLFGHTHHALCQQLEGGLWILNPGPSRSSYGLITITDGTIQCALYAL